MRRHAGTLVHAALAGVALTGCQIEVSFPQRDDGGGACTTGCDDAGAGGGDGAPAADSGDPEASTACGTMAALRDDFTGSGPGLEWDAWNGAATSYAQQDGQLVLRLDAGSGEPWVGVTSSAVFDLRGSQISVAVPKAGAYWTVVEARDHADRKVQIVVENRATLQAVLVDASGYHLLAEISYDPEVHQVLRLREQDGTLYWEASADRVAWTTLYAQVAPFALDQVFALLAAGGALASATEVRFDDFNTDAALVEACGVGSLRDDFVQPSLATTWAWSWADPRCTLQESGGELAMTFDGQGDSWCGVETPALFDARDDALVVDVAAAPPGTNFVTYLQLDSFDGEGYAWIERSPDGLYAEAWVGNTTVASATLPYDPSLRYWRIGEHAGTMTWDASADRITWTTVLTAPTPFDVSRVRIELGAGHWAPGPGTQTIARFAGVNPP